MSEQHSPALQPSYHPCCSIRKCSDAACPELAPLLLLLLPPTAHLAGIAHSGRLVVGVHVTTLDMSEGPPPQIQVPGLTGCRVGAENG